MSLVVYWPALIDRHDDGVRVSLPGLDIHVTHYSIPRALALARARAAPRGGTA